jgi:Zn-dependent protease
MDATIIRNFAIGVPGFLFAIVAHEWAHAYVAKKFGDNTAEQQGRLTLNPMSHIDPMGTVIWPIICATLGGFMFGWAKPVPVNPANFKKFKSGLFWVSSAGPLMNILIGVFSSLFLVLVTYELNSANAYRQPLIEIFKMSMYINFILAFFNLIPFPPLDGSKMVSSFLDYNTARKYEDLSRFGLIFMVILWISQTAQYIIFAPATWMAGQVTMIFSKIITLI